MSDTVLNGLTDSHAVNEVASDVFSNARDDEIQETGRPESTPGSPERDYDRWFPRHGSDTWITPEALSKVVPDADQVIVKKQKPTIFMSQHTEVKTEADEGKPTFEQGMRPEALPLYEGKSDTYYTNWVETKPRDIDYDDVEIKDQKREYAILVRNRRSRNNYALKAFEIDSIVVWSPLIKKTLKRVLAGYPGITLELSELEFSTPFIEFVHRWDRLEEATQTETDKQTKQHIELFQDTILSAIGPVLKILNGKALADKSSIAMRTIFQPGEWMISTLTGELGIFEKAEWETDSQGKDTYCMIRLANIDWNGSYVGYGSASEMVTYFDGIKPIRDLWCYPLRYATDIAKIKLNAIENGKKFISLAGIHYKSYTHSQSVQKRTDRIIIDAKAYYNKGQGRDYGPGGSYGLPPLTPLSEKLEATSNKIGGYVEIDQGQDNLAESTNEDTTKDADPNTSEDPDKKEPPTTDAKLPTPEKPLAIADLYHLTDIQLMLCRRHVYGFILKSKKWSSFTVAHIQDIKFNDSVFDNLVLPQAHKDIILGFVETQIDKDHNLPPQQQDISTSTDTDTDTEPNTNAPAVFDDFIEGKGRGLIFLLSGPPGVGKTFTVEAVAERLHAPLYPFSAIELGHNVATVERAFEEMLDTAGKWGAVLLLDEADVFLIQRTVSDLERNRLVSVFLRLLEYFEGVLFLTTNRASELDTAFESRVDVHLEYPPLDVDSRCEVWKNFIKQVSGPIELDEGEVKKISQVAVNGREIKSVIKQALLLSGGGKRGALRAEHIETVLRIRKARQIVG